MSVQGSWKNHWVVGIAAWIVAGAVFLVYIGYKSHGRSGINLDSLANGIDGTYVLEDNPSYKGKTAKVTIKGSSATLVSPDGTSGVATVDRKGNTIRFIDFQAYKDGFLQPSTDNSRVEIWKLVDDGQVIQFSQDGTVWRMVKQ